MKERISILLDYIPRYGEILLGIGSIAISYKEEILDNEVAREDLKKYLLEEAIKKQNVLKVSKSEKFQRLIYEYTGKFVNMAILTDKKSEDKIVNILLIDFFVRSIWPILVNKYIDNIYLGVDKIIVSINIKKNVYLTIYNEDNPDLFFKEFKEYLLYNHIVICEAELKENGDMLVKLMIPVPPNKKFKF